MALLENWRNMAYGDGLDKKMQDALWNSYFEVEKGIYKQILAEPTKEIAGTVKELAEKFDTDIMTMTGFLDGISESLLDYKNPTETMERIPRSAFLSTRRSSTTTWWKPRQSGSMNCRSGTAF